ncbi:MAG TPA: ABC transporter permease [Steroidobacteraceae bacterium]|nr:ABC transporter permease [Steroidobacteraceae bacterium]
MSEAAPRRRLDAGLAAAAAAGIIVVLAALVSLTGAFDAGLALNIDARLAAPSAAHWFGTDPLGRDVLAMIAAGARVSLGVSLGAVAIGVGAGVPLGLVAAVLGGVGDEAVARFNDLVFAMPSLLLAVLLAATMGPGPANAVIALGVFNVPVFARLARAGARTLLARDFVLAARVAGKGRLRIALEHLLPNLTGLLIVQATIQLALGIAAEAGLSYVGLGAQPPAPSWGRMLNDAQTLTAIAPWLAWCPGIALSVTVLALSVLGERLRDVFDPRARR